MSVIGVPLARRRAFASSLRYRCRTLRDVARGFAPPTSVKPSLSIGKVRCSQLDVTSETEASSSIEMGTRKGFLFRLKFNHLRKTCGVEDEGEPVSQFLWLSAIDMRNRESYIRYGESSCTDLIGKEPSLPCSPRANQKLERCALVKWVVNRWDLVCTPQ